MIQNIAWKSYIVYVVWLAIETTIIYCVYPETKGPMLEELGELFEKKDPLAKGELDIDVGHGQSIDMEKGSTAVQEVAK